MKIELEIKINPENEEEKEFVCKLTNQLGESIAKIMQTTLESLKENEVCETVELKMNEEISDTQKKFEEYLTKICNYKFNSHKKISNYKEDIQNFLDEISFFEISECTERAFEKVIELEEISVDSIIESIKEYFSEFSVNDIKYILDQDFKDWVKLYRPDVKENCPEADFICLIKYVAKKAKED